MELRQLRYFVTLTEELHFGRAAAREHIVQSALSQQLQRLERELGVRLLERNTHHVQLTAAGSAFLAEARQILAHTHRASLTAKRAARSVPTLRVGTVDASYDSMPLILRHVREQHPDLEIHEVEAGVPEQVSMLVHGQLDVGLGRACLAPPDVTAELIRLDPLGVLMPKGHPAAAEPGVPVTALAAQPLLLPGEERAPEFNQFVLDLCRLAGVVPTVYRGTVASLRAAAELVLQGRCVACAPASCVSVADGIVWRPVIEPAAAYPWSVLWRAGDGSAHVHAVVTTARRLSRTLGWLQSSSQEAG